MMLGGLLAFLFPRRTDRDQAHRLDAVAAAHLASTEALSRAANGAKASAKRETARADGIAEASRERFARQEERRRRRIAQAETAQAAVDRNR